MNIKRYLFIEGDRINRPEIIRKQVLNHGTHYAKKRAAELEKQVRFKKEEECEVVIEE